MKIENEIENLLLVLRAPWRKPENKPPEMEQAAGVIEQLLANLAVEQFNLNTLRKVKKELYRLEEEVKAKDNLICLMADGRRNEIHEVMKIKELHESH